MKKYIYFSIILLFTVSCENEIPFDIKDNPPKLIINAFFEAEKETNEIVLGLTGREKTTIIKDASIHIYVNGEIKDHITAPDAETDSYGNEKIKYKTNVNFKPEDVVRIEAQMNDGSHHAWSEVIVPEPVSIEKTDTTIVTKNSWWNNSDKFLRVKTTFTDDGQNTNYYRIAMAIYCEIEAKNQITAKDTILYKTLSETLYINEDIVLTDGRPSSDDNDNGLLAPVQNIWGIFDNSRIMGTYTMTASLRIPYSSLEYLIYDENDYAQIIEIKKISMNVKVKLLSISQMQYFYLKALNIYDSIDYDDYFNLPVRFPSNIEGGTGIFGVSIADVVTIPLPDYIPEN